MAALAPFKSSHHFYDATHTRDTEKKSCEGEKRKRRINRETFPTKRKKLFHFREGIVPPSTYVFLPILPRSHNSTESLNSFLLFLDLSLASILFTSSFYEEMIPTNHRRYCLTSLPLSLPRIIIVPLCPTFFHRHWLESRGWIEEDLNPRAFRQGKLSGRDY